MDCLDSCCRSCDMVWLVCDPTQTAWLQGPTILLFVIRLLGSCSLAYCCLWGSKMVFGGCFSISHKNSRPMTANLLKSGRGQGSGPSSQVHFSLSNSGRLRMKHKEPERFFVFVYKELLQSSLRLYIHTPFLLGFILQVRPVGA